jgi:hypothetical protein
MAPSSEEVRVATAQLRKYSEMWTYMSGLAHFALMATGRLNLNQYDVTWTGGEVLSTYNEVRELTETRLRDAQKTFDSLAEQLMAAARAYDLDETNAVHRMTGIY